MRRAAVITVLVVIVLAGVLFAPAAIDWNRYIPRAEKMLTDATGCPTRISGHLDLSLLPHPQITLSDVSIGGSNNLPIAHIRWARATLDMAELISGNLVVERLKAVEPRITIGRGSCVPGFLKDAVNADNADDRPASGGSSGESFLIRWIEAENGALLDGAGNPIVQQIDGDVRFRSGGDRVDATADVTIAGLRGRMVAGIGGLITKRERSIRIRFANGSGEATLEFTGEAAPTDSGYEVKGDVRARTTDVSRTLAQFLPEEAVAFSGMRVPLDLSSHISADSDSLGLDDVKMRLGRVSISGALVTALTDRPFLDATLALSSLDLDPKSPDREPGTDALSDTGALAVLGETLQAARAFAGFVPLSRRLDIGLHMTAQSLLYRGAIVRNAELSATLSKGGITLNQARAQLPGGSDIALYGFGEKGEQGYSFDGQVAFQSDDFRRFAKWIGLGITSIDPERMRSFKLQSPLKIGNGRVSLDGLDLGFDATHVTGSISGPFDRPGSTDIALKLDQINLDAYRVPTASLFLPLAGFDLMQDLAGSESNQTNKDGAVGSEEGDEKPSSDAGSISIDVSAGEGLWNAGAFRNAEIVYSARKSGNEQTLNAKAEQFGNAPFDFTTSKLTLTGDKTEESASISVSGSAAVMSDILSAAVPGINRVPLGQSASHLNLRIVKSSGGPPALQAAFTTGNMGLSFSGKLDHDADGYRLTLEDGAADVLGNRFDGMTGEIGMPSLEGPLSLAVIGRLAGGNGSQETGRFSLKTAEVNNAKDTGGIPYSMDLAVSNTPLDLPPGNGSALRLVGNTDIIGRIDLSANGVNAEGDVKGNATLKASDNLPAVPKGLMERIRGFVKKNFSEPGGLTGNWALGKDGRVTFDSLTLKNGTASVGLNGYWAPYAKDMDMTMTLRDSTADKAEIARIRAWGNINAPDLRAQ